MAAEALSALHRADCSVFHILHILCTIVYRAMGFLFFAGINVHAHFPNFFPTNPSRYLFFHAIDQSLLCKEAIIEGYSLTHLKIFGSTRKNSEYTHLSLPVCLKFDKYTVVLQHSNKKLETNLIHKRLKIAL